jgi:lysocardiolipin and lysophospholipid acyltransferase
MEQYMSTGRFPATPAAVDKKGSDDGFVETEVRTAHWFEILQVFVPAGLAALLFNFLLKIWTSFVQLFSRS